jgi:DNA-binding CsgD family transcriptional regulator
VLALAARGRPHKLIAYELGLGEPTVRTYERRAMEKLGLASRAELVRLFAGLT